MRLNTETVRHYLSFKLPFDHWKGHFFKMPSRFVRCLAQLGLLQQSWGAYIHWSTNEQILWQHTIAGNILAVMYLEFLSLLFPVPCL